MTFRPLAAILAALVLLTAPCALAQDAAPATTEAAPAATEAAPATTEAARNAAAMSAQWPTRRTIPVRPRAAISASSSAT